MKINGHPYQVRCFRKCLLFLTQTDSDGGDQPNSDNRIPIQTYIKRRVGEGYRFGNTGIESCVSFTWLISKDNGICVESIPLFSLEARQPILLSKILSPNG